MKRKLEELRQNLEEFVEQTDYSVFRAAPGGRHGAAAVNILVRYYSPRKAPPGFSNHSDGRAVDFVTTQAGVSYGAEGRQRAAWRTTWLHQWLVANAGRFRFHPLASEEWHWDHR